MNDLDKSRLQATNAAADVSAHGTAAAPGRAQRAVALAIVYLADCIRAAQPAPAPQQGRAAGAEEEER